MNDATRADEERGKMRWKARASNEHGHLRALQNW